MFSFLSETNMFTRAVALDHRSRGMVTIRTREPKDGLLSIMAGKTAVDKGERRRLRRRSLPSFD